MKLSYAVAAAAALLGAQAANATIAVVFNDFDSGFASFGSTVAGAGGDLALKQLDPNSSASFTDFTITRNNGGSTAYIGSVYNLYASSPSRNTTGGMISIDPQGPNTTPRADPLDYKSSGVTFNFAEGINALGFEVGDWATCCQPSNIYIQFGNNTPIMVGASTLYGDQFLTNKGAGVFVAAFDDTDTFTTVSFWGDGVGEVLNLGGTIRYSAIDIGSLPPTGPVPEPATWAMMIAGFGIAGAAMRRRRATSLSFA